MYNAKDINISVISSHLTLLLLLRIACEERHDVRVDTDIIIVTTGTSTGTSTVIMILHPPATTCKSYV